MNHQPGLPLLAQINRPLRKVQDSEIALYPTEEGAHRLCMSQSQPRLTYETLAARLTESGIPMTKGRLNKIFNADTAHDKPARSWRVLQIHVQRICNNRVIDRWAELYESQMLNCQRPELELQQEQDLADAEALVARLRAERGVA